MKNSDLRSVLAAAGSRFTRNQPASQGDIEELERMLTTGLPNEYKDFLLWSNGGELAGDGQALDFWDTHRVVARNERLQIAKRLPKIVLIGSNEGETALGFEHDSGSFVAVPFGDLSSETTKIIAPSAGMAIEMVLSREIDLDEVCYR